MYVEWINDFITDDGFEIENVLFILLCINTLLFIIQSMQFIFRRSKVIFFLIISLPLFLGFCYLRIPLIKEKFTIKKCGDCKAKVVKIIDGNTILVKLDTSQFVDDSIIKIITMPKIEPRYINLSKINVFKIKDNAFPPKEVNTCNEKTIKDIWAEEAKIKLINLIYNKNVEIKCDSVEKCYVFFQGKDINKEMVRSGMAWADDYYYKETEYQAKKQNLGIWDFYSKTCK